MYTAKVVTGVLFHSRSYIFRDVYADLMKILRIKCQTARDCAEGVIFDGDREVCYIKCYSDCYMIHYVGYSPMWFKLEV